jgi:hypothetical protein
VTDAKLVAAGARAVKENAQRLGLVWTMRQCTIVTNNEAQIKVILDGDTGMAGVPVVSLVGKPAVSARYMALIIPDCVFLLECLTGSVQRELTNRVFHANNADLSVTTTQTLIGDCDVTVNVTGLATWEASAVFDIQVTAAAATIFVGELFVDGAAVLGQALMQVTVAPDRRTVMQMWEGTFLTGGDHRFQLFGSKTANVATLAVKNLHTRFKVETFE